MPIFNQTLGNELLHTGKLSRKHRGELAELAFMRKAAAFGFGVAKPWGDCDRYDVILRADKVFWRVQVKSVWSTEPTRKHYRIKTSGNLHIPYTAEQIDFLVAYIFPKDAWYVFPVALVENRESVCVSPGRAKSRLEPYREAWGLMWPDAPAPAPTQNIIQPLNCALP